MHSVIERKTRRIGGSPLRARGPHAARAPLFRSQTMPPWLLLDNQTMLRLLDEGRLGSPRGTASIQRKPLVGPPADHDERVADRAAEFAVRAPHARTATSTRGMRAGSGRPELPRRAVGVPTALSDELRRPGQRLDSATEERAESWFGKDFSGVRIHTGAGADRAARAVEARAFTFGNSVVFGSGRYTPSTSAGQKLLAHELTHVIQQERNLTGRPPDASIQCQQAAEEDGPTASDPESRLADIVAESLADGDLDDRTAEGIGSAALSSVGYETLLAIARNAGVVQTGRPSPELSDEDEAGGVIQRQGGAAAGTFGQVFTRYAVAAGIASQVDSPAPGPGDLIALGILAVGLVAATIAVTQVRTKARKVPRSRKRRNRWTCDAQCNVQQINPDAECPDRVYGTGTGASKEEACRAAKRAATQATPPGCYPRHCRCYNCRKS